MLLLQKHFLCRKEHRAKENSWQVLDNCEFSYLYYQWNSRFALRWMRMKWMGLLPMQTSGECAASEMQCPLETQCIFFNMKFIVKLVSIQHPMLIPKGALLNTHHPPTPCQPSVCSQFLRVSYALALSLSSLFFLLPLPHGLLLSSSGSTKEWNSPIKKWTENMNRHFSKEDIQMSNSTWKDAQRCSSSGKYKSKPHSDITSCQSEWPKWTN